MLDILIKHANIIDGSGKPAYLADVAIEGGKICAIGSCDEPAKQRIDAAGLCLAPGFIDAHGHSDIFAFADPLRASKLCQGITTELCGQCGLGPAPISKEFYEEYQYYFKSQGSEAYPNSKEFTSFGAYLQFMERFPMGINMAYFIPHGTVRMAVMGLSPQAPTQEQLDAMCSFVQDAMENGALGLSSGLMYAPGMFADEQELTTLCKVVGKYGGIYTSHIRDQGNKLVECVAETIRVAENAGARVNISHHKASGKNNWGKVKSTCELIHNAGVPAMHDVYPYSASSTMIRSLLPPYVQKMNPDEIIMHLSDAGNHEALKQAISSDAADFESPLLSCGYDGILIIHATITKDAVGKTITQYAEYLGIDAFDALLKILTENLLGAAYIGFSMCEDDIETLIADTLCAIGTDALYVQGMEMTHPRAIGTFPRVLGRYVREKKIITLEEAIRKMTSMPANFYGLQNKGGIEEGKDADIVLFDANTIIDHADYLAPLLPNDGIKYVLVNGEIALVDNIPTGNKNGKTVRAAFNKKQQC